MANKLLDTRLLPIIKEKLITLMENVDQSSLDSWVDGASIREYLKVSEIGTFLTTGRTYDSTSDSLGFTCSFSPVLGWGAGDCFAMLYAESYSFNKTNEQGISLIAGTNNFLGQAYIAKTDWVKTYLENQKTTTQDIENLFS